MPEVIRWLDFAAEPVAKRLIRLLQQGLETGALLRRQLGIATVHEIREDQIKFKRPSPAAPAQAV